MNKEKRARLRRERVSDLMLLGGMALVAAGAWLMHPAAGLIVAGVGAMVVGALIAMGSKGGEP